MCLKVDDIKNFIFNLKLKNHTIVQNEITSYFQRDGYDVKLEYDIKFRMLYRRKDKPPALRNGKIDIFAQKGNFKIGIEYDTSQVIRWKSLEKLLQLDCQLCIAITNGTTEKSEEARKKCLENNVDRTRQVIKEVIDYFFENDIKEKFKKMKYKDFWIFIVNLNVSKIFKMDGFSLIRKFG